MIDTKEMHAKYVSPTLPAKHSLAADLVFCYTGTSHLKNKLNARKGNDRRLPTIHFQGAFAVSFREGMDSESLLRMSFSKPSNGQRVQNGAAKNPMGSPVKVQRIP